MGPEGGDAGVEVVMTGTPWDFIAHPQASHTARFLHEYVRER
jgi:excinuclease UvrABC ATPase subunit